VADATHAAMSDTKSGSAGANTWPTSSSAGCAATSASASAAATTTTSATFVRQQRGGRRDQQRRYGNDCKKPGCVYGALLFIFNSASRPGNATHRDYVPLSFIKSDTRRLDPTRRNAKQHRNEENGRSVTHNQLQIFHLSSRGNQGSHNGLAPRSNIQQESYRCEGSS